MYKKIAVSLLVFTFSTVSKAENSYELALKSFDANDIESSYIHLKNSLAANQENLPAKILMGHVLLRKGLYQDAIQEFNDAIALGADLNPFVYEMGRALMFNKQFDQVIALSDSQALNQESRIKLLLLNSNAYVALRKPSQALDALKRAHAIDSDNLSTITSLASFYLNQRQFSESRQYLDKAIEIAPENNRVWQLNGEFYNAQGKGSDALSSFLKAHELNTSDPVVMRSLANQYSVLNDLDESLKFADKILAITPFDTYTKLLKSRVLIRNGQEKEAQLILESISSRLSLLTDAQKNSDPSITFVSGSAAFLQGNYEQAQKDLIYYVNTKPEDITGINMLVEIYQSQKQQDKIEALLERFESRIKKDLYLSLKLYNIYLKNNKIYKAKSLLNELETYYTNNLLIIIAKASYLVSSNRQAEAIALLERNRPKTFNGVYELNLANLYLSIPDFTNAESIADKLLLENEKSPQYLVFKGVVLSKQQEWGASIQYFDKAVAIDENNFAAKYNKVNALASLNKTEEAITLISPMVDNFPENYELLMLFAKLKRDNGDSAKAIETLTSILKRKPRFLAASDVLFGIYYQQNQFELALEEAERLTANSFLDPKYITYKAKALTQLERYEDANVQLGKIMGLADTASDFYQLSKMQIAAKYYENALSSIDRAIKKDSTSQFYQLEKAKLLLTLNRDTESKAILDSLSRININDANLRYTYGLWYIQSKQFKRAYTQFDKALEIDKYFTGALIKMYVLAQQGVNTDLFTATLLKVVEENPDNSFTRNLLADLYLTNGKMDKALPHYLAIENDTSINQSNVLNNIANIYAENDNQKALSYIERASALEGNSPDILDTYGWILSLTGDYKGSLAKLREASAIKANDPLIRYHLGYTLEKMGRLEDAKIELSKAVNTQGEFAEKGAAQLLLDKIK